MKPIFIAVVGSKGSGKTTMIEVLTRELSRKGYKIAAVKHIPEPNFTIDKKGKDTWRFAKAGARKILSVASNEIAMIEKVDTKNFSLDEILHRCNNVDLIFIESFKKIVGKNVDVPKIVAVRSAEEAQEAIKNFEPILALTGLYSTENLNLEIPYFDALKASEKIVNMVEKLVEKRRWGKDNDKN